MMDFSLEYQSASSTSAAASAAASLARNRKAEHLALLSKFYRGPIPGIPRIQRNHASFLAMAKFVRCQLQKCFVDLLQRRKSKVSISLRNEILRTGNRGEIPGKSKRPDFLHFVCDTLAMPQPRIGGWQAFFCCTTLDIDWLQSDSFY